MPYALPKTQIHIDHGSGNQESPVNMDINGDGLLDLVFSLTAGASTKQYVALNRGGKYELVYTCHHYNYNNN